MHLIFDDIFWFVRRLLVCIVRFLSLAEFPANFFSYPVVGYFGVGSNNNTDTKTYTGKNRWTLLFLVRTVLLTSDFGSSTRRERHNSYYANNPQRAVHLAMFKISVSRDPKIPTTSFNGQNSTLCLHGPISTSQLTLFQNLQILRTISSGHDVMHTPASFPVWGFIMTIMVVISFVRKRKLHQVTIHLGS